MIGYVDDKDGDTMVILNGPRTELMLLYRERKLFYPQSPVWEGGYYTFGKIIIDSTVLCVI
jgi:hypothetical protein